MEIMSKLLFVYTFMLLSLTGCFFQADEVEPSDALLQKQGEVEFARQRELHGAKVDQLAVSGNQINVDGRNLQGVKSARLKGPGLNIGLPIESKEESSLVLDISRNLELISNTVFQLVLTDAYGASSFQLVFTIQDGAVTNAKIADNTIDGKKIAPMNASEGDVLTWNNTDAEWEPRTLTGQNFIGTWDSQANNPDLDDDGYTAGGAPNPGDYYIVVGSGGGNVTINSINSWADGDWIIFNGTTWEHIAIATPAVSQFNGQTGAITFNYPDLDFSTSTINDFADVDTTTFTPNSGQVLKWNGSEWAPADDNDAGGADSVQSSTIQDGSIVDADVSNLAGISQSKIAGLTGALNSKLDNVGGAMTGNLNMSNNDIQNVGTATVTNLTVTGNMDYASNSTTPVFENNTDTNSKGDALVLRRRRADAGSVAGTEFGASLSFEAEGFTNGSSIPQAKVTAGWETSQTNDTTDRDSFITFSTSEDGAVTESMRIDSQGDVGIGTNDPDERLHIQDNDTDPRLKIVNSSSTSARYPGVMIENYNGADTGGAARIVGRSAQGSDISTTVSLVDDILLSVVGAGYNGTTGDSDNYNQAASIQILASETFTGSSTPGSILFSTTPPNTVDNPQPRMLIDDSGNIGIGNIAPTNALHITEVDDNWTSGFRMDRSWDSNTDYFQMMYDYAGLKIRTMADGSDEAHIIFKPKDAEAMRISEDGKIGMGTTSPSSKLEVAGNLSSALTGDIDLVSGNAVNVGNGTSFTTEISNGQKLLIGGVVYTVVDVVSNSQVELSPTPTVNLSSATVYEMGSEAIFKVTDGNGDNIFSAAPNGVTFNSSVTFTSDVASTSTENNDSVVIQSNADGGTDSILMQSNGTEQMEIKSTGDVEIGNTDLGIDGLGTVLAIGGAAGNYIGMGQDNDNFATMGFNATTGAFSISTESGGTPYSNTLYMDDGAVGINTNTLTNGRLSVNGADQTAIYASTTDQSDYQLELKNDAYNSTAKFAQRDNGNLQFIAADNGSSPGEFEFHTDGSLRVTIDNEGKMGIGGNNPSFPLDVQGRGGSNPNNYVLRIAQTSTTGAGTDANALIFFTSSNGSESRNWVMGSGSVTRFGQAKTFGIYDLSSGTDIPNIAFEDTGDTGIGIADPAAGLHLGSGKVLRIDGQPGSDFAGGGQILFTNGAFDQNTAIGSTTSGMFVKTRTTGSAGAVKFYFGAADNALEFSNDGSGAAEIAPQGASATSLNLDQVGTITGKANSPLTIIADDQNGGDDGLILKRSSRHLSANDDAVASFWFDTAEVARVTTGGEFGVGTDAPNATIEAKSATPGMTLTDSDNTIAQTAYQALFQFRDSSNAQVGQMGYVNTDQNFVLKNFATTGDMDFVTNSGQIKLQADGKLGVGTTSPDVQMVLSGGALCVSSDANCDGNANTEGQIQAAQICDETGANCADISQGIATSIDSLNDGAIKSTSLYLGYSAGATETGSATSKNLGVGQSALTLVNSGEQNIAVGYGAADSVSGGDANIAVGVASLSGITNGNNNVAVGASALSTSVAGSDNVAIGHNAGQTASGTSNNNVFLGSGTGPSPSATVLNTIAIGQGAQTNGDNAIAIGQGAVAAANQTVIGSSSTTDTIIQGQVGLNGQTPAADLHLITSAGGDTSGVRLENSGGQVVDAYLTDATATSSYNLSVNGTGGADLVIQDDGDMTLAAATGGNVSIGTTSTDAKLHIAGTTDSVVKLETSSTNGSSAYFTSTASASDGQVIGSLFFQGENDLSANLTYSKIFVRQAFTSNGNEDSEMLFTNMVGGTTQTPLIIKAGDIGIGNITPEAKLHVGDAPTAGLANVTRNVLLLEGNSVADDAAENSYDGTFGMLHFNANADLGLNIERQYVLTNAYQGGSFAILQSSTNTSTPTLSTNSAPADSVVNGDAIFSINNAGTVEINKGHSSPPTVGLEVNGEIKFTASSGYGIRFEDGTVMTSAGAGSAATVSATGNSTITSDSDGAGGGDILFQIGNGGTPTVADINATGMSVGNTDNNMSFTTTGGAITAAMDSTTKNGGAFQATNDNSTSLTMKTYASDDGGTTFGVSNNDMTIISTSGANSTGLAMGTTSADPIVFGTNGNEAMRIDANGKVMVGRTTADADFHISATATANGDNKQSLIIEEEDATYAQGIGPGIEFKGIYDLSANRAALGGIKAVRTSSVSGNQGGALAFITSTSAGSVGERMRIDEDGLVGIGTTDPSADLEISRNSGSNTSNLRLRTTNTAVADDEVIGEIDFYSDDSTTAGSGAFIRGVAEAGSSGASTQLQLGTGTNASATTKMIIKADGSVNLGDSTQPAATLDLQDTVTGYPGVMIRGKAGTELDLAVPAGEAIQFGQHDGTLNGGTTQLSIDSGGDVSIGTTVSDARLVVGTSTGGGATLMRAIADDSGNVFSVNKDVNDDGNIIVYDTSGNSDVKFNTAGDSWIMSTGEFGINTNTPDYPLTVEDTGNDLIGLKSTASKQWAIGADANQLYFKNITDTVTAFSVDNNGEMGFGETSPEANIHATDTEKPAIFQATSATDDAKASLVLRRTRSDAANPGSTTPGAFENMMSFEMETFTDGTSVSAAQIGVRWTQQQTNNTTDRDSEIVFRTMSDDTMSEVMIIDENGHVGIGTADPSDRLTVKATDNLTTNYPIQVMNNADTLRTGYGAYGMSNKVGTAQTIDYTMTVGGDIILSPDGYVGIGVTPTDGNLHIKSTSSNYEKSIVIENTTTTGLTQMSLKGTGHIYSIGTGNDAEATFGVADKFIIGDVSNNTIRVAMDSAGNFGIGTTSPDRILHLSGSDASADKAELIRLESTDDTPREWDINIKEGKFVLGDNTGGLDRFAIDTAGNVGIGTTAPETHLHVRNDGDQSVSGTPGMKIENQGGTLNDFASFVFETDTGSAYVFKNPSGSTNFGGAGSFNIGTGAAENFSLLTSFTTRVLIDAVGNVGIGTLNPDSLLHVDGGAICVTSDDDCAGSTAGTVYAENTTVQAADYAEYFLTDGRLQAGDIVGINPNTGLVRYYQAGDILLGIVSTSPGVLGNSKIQNDTAEAIALMGQVPFNRDQVVIEGRSIKTLDGKNLGTLLASGDIFLSISSADDRQDRQIASLKEEVDELKSENEMMKAYLCSKDPDAPFCQ